MERLTGQGQIAPNSSLSKPNKLKGLVPWLVAIAGAALAAILIFGCGGSGHGGGSASIVIAQGQVVLPPGFTIPMSRLVVGSPAGDVAPDAQGKFKVPTDSAGPTTVQLIDTATDKVVMLGYVDAASGGSPFAGGHGDISPTSTANALLYLGLNAYMMPPDQWETMREVIASAPQTATVAAVVSTRLAANPTALSDGDAQIEAAVQQVQNSVSPPFAPPSRGQAGVASMSTVSVGPRGSGRAGTLVDVSPQGPVSGVEITNDPKSDGIIFTNHFRRRAAAFIYEVATIDQQGNTTHLVPPKELTFQDSAGLPTNAFDIDAANSLNGTVGTLSAGLAGQYFFQPSVSDGVSVPAEPSAAKTIYNVVVVGPSPLQLTENPQASEVANDDPTETSILLGEWNAKKDQLMVREFVLDVFAPTIFNFLPIGNEVKDALGKRDSSLAADLGGIVTSLPDVNRLVEAGKFKEAWVALMPNLVDSTAIRLLIVKALTKLSARFLLDQSLDHMLQRLYKANLVIDDIDTGLAAIDIAKVMLDFNASLPAALWTVTALPSKVTLSPANAEVDDVDNIVPLAVTIQNQTDLSQFRFQWSTTGLQGHLEASGSSTALPTGQIPDFKVDYVADLLKLQVGRSDTVTVKVFLASDPVNAIGTATSTIKAVTAPPCGALPPPVLATGPGSPTLTLNKKVYHAGDTMTASFTIAPGNTDQFVWVMDFFPSPGHVVFAKEMSVDGVPVFPTKPDAPFIEIRGNILHPGQAETHTVTFLMVTPTDDSGDPTSFCAGGFVNSSFIGPAVSVEIFSHSPPQTECWTFFDEAP